MKKNVRQRSSTAKSKTLVVAALVIVLGFVGWWALRSGPAPDVTLVTSRPAIGPSTSITAQFSAAGGLRSVALEIEQGGRTEKLAEETFPRPGVLALLRGTQRRQATLTAEVGTLHQNWLANGAVAIRAVATRSSGPLRSPEAASVEHRMAVLLTPPRLEVVSRQNYVDQGGSGVVVFRVSETAVRSGVRAGDTESEASVVPGGDDRDRFALYGVPYDVASGTAVLLFAEDDAGNRVEQPFLDLFKPRPPRTDTVRLSDSFLDRVVPAILDRAPDLTASGALLDRYLRINGELRAKNLQTIRDIVDSSAATMLWSGAFAQMPNTARMAGFAERRTYLYDGRPVDHQTHLGLDLASVAGAPVPAANSGRVVFADWLGIYGNTVILDHGCGLATLYGHLSSVDVHVGDTVEKGKLIAHTGVTGLAGGDHLHLEIFVHGISVNPLEWLDPNWVSHRIVDKLPASLEGVGGS